MPRTAADVNTKPCNICGKVIRYKSDVPRHNRLHTTDKEALMYKCPFEGCQYQNLQKSNVTTHHRTHTGEKPKSCPTCEYTTSDPGSLTRHRKRAHGYEPKKRSSPTKKASGSTRPTRYSPYARESSAESSSTSFTDLSSSSEPSPQPCQESLDLSTLYDLCFSTPSQYDTPSEGSFTFAWQKDNMTNTTPLTPFESFIAALPSQSNPRHLYSATDAGRSLEVEGGSLDVASPAGSEFMIDFGSSTSFNDLMLEMFDSPAVTEPIEPSLTLPTLPMEACTNMNTELDWSFVFGDSPSPPDQSFYTGSPNSSNYSPFSSPPSSGLSLCGLPDAGAYSPEGGLDYIFPNPLADFEAFLAY